MVTQMDGISLKRAASFALLAAAALCGARAQTPPAATPQTPAMFFADASRLGVPFAKDPSVIRFHGRYWMYYSVPASTRDHNATAPGTTGWSIGVAQSNDLVHWTKVGEVSPVQDVERDGIAAPGARVLNGKVELFYQTYGHAKLDAICHATSGDGLHFDRDPSNPVYRPMQMPWSVGRAIDAEVYPYGKQLLLLFATRDPAMKIQEIGLAAAPLGSGYGRGTWRDLSTAKPVLAPLEPWEMLCIEAPTLLTHNGLLYLFYAGGYNNAPQQIGVATSRDGRKWKRLYDHPLLANGAPGTWNSSESGHPGVFTDDDGKTYLFFQGNNDHGRTWYLSVKEIRWHGMEPYLVDFSGRQPLRP